MTRNILLPALACAAFMATPALAQDHIRPIGADFLVRTGDLDLSQPGGRATLLGRVEAAGMRLCRHITPRVDRVACVNRAATTAMAGAPQPLRVAFYSARLSRETIQYAGR